jgi:hypothetical protein
VYLYKVHTQIVKGAWCRRRIKVFLVVVGTQFKHRGRSARVRVAVRVIKTWWERGGRSKNLQGTYLERNDEKKRRF